MCVVCCTRVYVWVYYVQYMYVGVDWVYGYVCYFHAYMYVCVGVWMWVCTLYVGALYRKCARLLYKCNYVCIMYNQFI